MSLTTYRTTKELMDKEIKIIITPEGLVTIKLSHFSEHEHHVFMRRLSGLLEVPIEKIIEGYTEE